MKEALLKTIPEDFNVTEVPEVIIRHECKKGDFRYIWLRKKGITTFEAVETLAKTLQCSPSTIGYAGLKDEDAVTMQLFSVPNTPTFKNDTILEGGEQFISVQHAGFGENKVLIGRLHGNAFSVTLRRCGDGLAERLNFHRKFLPFVNYFDMQRFGLPQKPHLTHLLGKALLEDDFMQAGKLLFASGNTDNEPTSIEECQRLFKCIEPRKRAFFINSWNSFLWNTSIAQVIKKSYHCTIIPEEHGIEFAIPTDIDSYLSLARFTPSICKYRIAENDITIDENSFRNAVICANVCTTSVKDDDFFTGFKKVTLNFFLPCGSYATMLIRHLLFM